MQVMPTITISNRSYLQHACYVEQLRIYRLVHAYSHWRCCSGVAPLEKERACEVRQAVLRTCVPPLQQTHGLLHIDDAASPSESLRATTLINGAPSTLPLQPQAFAFAQKPDTVLQRRQSMQQLHAGSTSGLDLDVQMRDQHKYPLVRM